MTLRHHRIGKDIGLAPERSLAARYRPSWRTPVSNNRTEKHVGEIEMTSDGFFRKTADGFVRVGEGGG